MASYKVTLRAPLTHGTFYWVAEVSAGSEDEAVTAAEHLFMAEIESLDDWAFDDYAVEPTGRSER